MKSLKKSAIVALTALALLIAAFALPFGAASPSAAAYAAGAYDFEFTAYEVTYDVRADRTMDVKMDLTVRYLGDACTGFIYDIPVNAGDRVRNVKAYELDPVGTPTALEYTMENSADFVSVNIGDYSVKTDQTHTYRITYEYAITRPTAKNAIYLNAVGFGSEAAMNDVSVTIRLPDGLSSVECYTSRAGSDEPYDDFVLDGNTVSLNIDELSAFHGVSFSLTFEDGVLSTRADLTPYWIVVAACVVFAVLFAVKLLRFNKNDLTPIPCFSVPKNPTSAATDGAYYADNDPTEEMDPLAMGKLIDNKVDNGDVTSLIYYWANKGYLKINLENENDIELIRIRTILPANSPHYQQVMYNALFRGKDTVRVNQLENHFYATVEAVTKEVNEENGRLYDGKSMTVAIIFALLGALVLCATPILLAMATISVKLVIIAPLFMVIPVFAVFALTQTVRYRSMKYSKTKCVLLYAGIALLSLLFTGFYVLLVPSYVVEILPKFLLGVTGFAIVMLSVSLICRTKEYTEKLNRILGFKDFIETTEKDKLETMLESNPELYYKVLPFAIVLGVSDVWTDKFKELTVVPPPWATSAFRNGLFDFMLFNTVMRNVNVNMARTFVSRPSAQSKSGFSGGSFGGGSFGGFSGGGHGGGGFRGR